MTLLAPNYSDGSLVNLVAAIERSLTGVSPSPPLSGGLLPEADGWVVVLFDGLGAHQLGSPEARDLSASLAARITAGFPTTTTTSMATIATGHAPAHHGLIGHMLPFPGMEEVVNVLKWVTPSGKPVEYDYSSVLPSPNLWERLARAGIEPITVQPGAFMGSPLSRLLYRGCRFEAAWKADEIVEATVDLARPGRLVFAYYPNVDVAAHVAGQDSEAYRQALGEAARLWSDLARRLPGDVALVGTADHGHLDYSAPDKVLIRDRRYDRLRFYGDPRSVYVDGPIETIEELAGETGAEVVGTGRLLEWLGGPPSHPSLDERLPDRLLLAPHGKVLLPRPFDKRLIGYHGGVEPEESEVPLLVRQ